MEVTCSVVFVQPRGLDLLYDVAEPQGGYFTTRLAATTGVSTRLLTHYAAAGDIKRVAHGVYRLERFPAHRFGDMIAATLWAGPGSAISHDSALTVYELAGAMPAVIHITVPHRFRGRRPGTVIHQQALTPREVTVWDDVPVTVIERTIVDVATGIDPSLAAEAVQQAQQQGLTTRERLIAYADAHPDHAALRRMLELDKARLRAV
ncbi:MAG: hypothetical protein DLM55_00150 [Acidimicrobiales bacterium]|nr:MAG: hypothetical protein DLM55_00150 [Acidimicrobiales bacterium]